MKSYFFVPANRLHKIIDVQELGVDSLIIDLEDSIKMSNISIFIENLVKVEAYKEHYLRLHVLNDNLELDLTHFNYLARNGFKYFIIPKLQNISQARDFFSLVKNYNFQFIILVESPRLFIQLDAMIEEFSSQICAIGIGSHDLLSLIGAKHTIGNLEFVRQIMLYTIKAHDKEAIDFASMNIKDEKSFSFELQDSFEKGFDAKFFIHPWQIKMLKQINFYTQKDYQWATKIYKELEKLNFNEKEFNALKIDDQIVEKPHINKAMKIIEYLKNNYETK